MPASKINLQAAAITKVLCFNKRSTKFPKKILARRNIEAMATHERIKPICNPLFAFVIFYSNSCISSKKMHPSEKYLQNAALINVLRFNNGVQNFQKDSRKKKH